MRSPPPREQKGLALPFFYLSFFSSRSGCGKPGSERQGVPAKHGDAPKTLLPQWAGVLSHVLSRSETMCKAVYSFPGGLANHLLISISSLLGLSMEPQFSLFFFFFFWLKSLQAVAPALLCVLTGK